MSVYDGSRLIVDKLTSPDPFDEPIKYLYLQSAHATTALTGGPFNLPAIESLTVRGDSTFAGSASFVNVLEGANFAYRGQIVTAGIFVHGLMQFFSGTAILDGITVEVPRTLRLFNVETNGVDNRGITEMYGGHTSGVSVTSGAFHYFGGQTDQVAALVRTGASMFLYGPDLVLSGPTPFDSSFNEYSVTGHLYDGTFLNGVKIRAEPGAVVALGVAPEPGTLALFCIGLGAVAGLRRREIATQ